jgi:hypothetical protein
MNERIEKRLRKDRPMTTISIRVPEDLIDDLKLVAPVLGFRMPGGSTPASHAPFARLNDSRERRRPNLDRITRKESHAKTDIWRAN